MKPFQTVEIVKCPVDDLCRAIRDRLAELVPHLDDIRSVTVEHREELPGGIVKLVNLWRAEAALPAVLNSVFKPDYFAWTDRATWNAPRRECTWQIELHFDRERTRCRGATRFEPALGGKGARVVFAGEFSMNARGMRGVPVLLESSIENAVEAFVTSLIPRNFRKLVHVAADVATGNQAAAGSTAGLIR